jgi:DNA-binding NarL/FixJ family response regulator
MALNTLLICNDQSRRREIEELIALEKSLTLLETVSGIQAQQRIESVHPSLVWIDLDPHPVRSLALLGELKRLFPQISFLLSHDKPDQGLMRLAFRLGASDYLDPESWKSDLPAAAERIQNQQQQSTIETAASPPESRPLVTLLVCDSGQKKRETIEDLIWSQKSLTLAKAVSTANALESVRLIHPKLVWIELGPHPQRAFSVLADVKTNFPQVHVFVSYDKADPALIRASYRLGASDFLDAERWRMELPAAVKMIQPQKQHPVRRAVIAWLAVFALLGYLFLHGH